MFGLQVLLHIPDEDISIHDEEDAMGSQMLTGSDDLEVDESNQHCHHRAQGVKHAVCDVNSHVELIDEHRSQDKNWDYVDDETISAPSSDHIEILQGACNSPQNGSCVHSSNPEEECVDESSDRDCLIIVRASNTSRDVRWHNGDEESSKEAGVDSVCALFRQEEGRHGGESSKHRSQEDTYVPDIKWEGEEVKCPFDESRGDHDPWENGSTNDSAKWVPRLTVIPIPKVVKAFIVEVLGGPVIEPRVKLVDN